MGAIFFTAEQLNSNLVPKGMREGADRGEPLISATPVAWDLEGTLGYWRCTPGSWEVIERNDTEMCFIVDGRGSIEDYDTNESFDLTPGSLLVLPKGWSGRWTIAQTLVKVFVIQ